MPHGTHQVRRAAVLGHPIQHSLSPVLHHAAYQSLGLDWSYEAIDLDVAALPDFLVGLGSEWIGLSLTMPLKEAVLAQLTTRTALVDQAQAANTVLIDADGLHGHNTDVPGFVAACAQHGVASARSATILGTGATARSALLALAHLGVGHVNAVGRSASDLHRIAELGRSLGVTVEATPWSGVGAVLLVDLLVSTVPSAVGADVAPLLRGSLGTLFEVLYDPWPTPLAAAWGERGQVIGGLDLLVHQARLQVELMTGRPAPLDVMRTAGQSALAARSRP